jgi:surface-anchored protein
MSFAGRPGQTLWMIPQVQKAGVPWLGWNTEELTARQVRGAVSWSLLGVRGPGRVTVFQTGTFGAHDILFSSARKRPGTRRVPLGTHAHGNWTFARPGVYRLTFRLRVRAAGSGRLLSDTRVLRVEVGR